MLERRTVARGQRAGRSPGQQRAWCSGSFGGSDVPSGRELSDGCEGAFGGGRLEGKPARKHHRRSTRARSRQERATRPRLTILNVRAWAGPAGGGAGGRGPGGAGPLPGLTTPASPGVQHG